MMRPVGCLLGVECDASSRMLYHASSRMLARGRSDASSRMLAINKKYCMCQNFMFIGSGLYLI